jgi:hypothetical protein
MRCVVLCRTDMNQDRFCTIVRTSDGQNLRLLTTTGQPTYAGFFGRNPALREQWIPGRVIQVWFQCVCARTRPTHPEDSIKSDRVINVTRRCLDADQLYDLVEADTFTDIRACFPNITFANSKGYVLGGMRLNHSVGYLEVQRLTIRRDEYQGKVSWRAWVVDGVGSSFQVPIKDVQLLQQIQADQVTDGQVFYPRLVFLGLSTPFTVDEEQRAYLQLLHMLL